MPYLIIFCVALYLLWKIYNFYLQTKYKWDPKLFKIFKTYSRIRLIGCAASGKSTLTNNLFLKIPNLKLKFHYISLDNIKHKKNSNFKLIRGEQYKEALNKELKKSELNFNNKWIMDGNAIANKKLKNEIWNKTQVVILFNYNFWIVFIREINII